MTTPLPDPPPAYCVAHSPGRPCWIIGPPLCSAHETSDLDDLASLERSAFDEYHRLGRRLLRHLAARPTTRLCERHPVLPSETDLEPDRLRLLLVARLWHETAAPADVLLPITTATFRRCGPLRGALWLELSPDGLAGPQSYGAAQIIRLTVSPRDPLGPDLVDAFCGLAAEPPPAFLPPDWPPFRGLRPVTAFLPAAPQPAEWHQALAALGFAALHDEPHAYGQNRPGRFYLHANGLANIRATLDKGAEPA